MNKRSFGTLPEGQEIELYDLKSPAIEASFMTYGASVVGLRTPDKSGEWDDIVLGFPDLAGYFDNHRSNSPVYFGSAIGRYGNRIAGAKFSLDGRQYTLKKNNGENSLHGGPGGFHNVVWSAKPEANSLAFHYLSKDGEEGFPGNLAVTVLYTVANSDLRIDYLATTDKPTVLSLTNHSYFNLSGAGRGSILPHHLKLFASEFTVVDEALIPTGEIRGVEGTPFDFRKSTEIGSRFGQTDEQLRFCHGYDHNFVLPTRAGEITQAAELYDPKTGRVMEVWTSEPAIQFYSGNFLNDTIKGKGGAIFGRQTGLCLETQHYPDSPNQPAFPSTILRPGDEFKSTTIFRFSTRK